MMDRRLSTLLLAVFLAACGSDMGKDGGTPSPLAAVKAVIGGLAGAGSKGEAAPPPAAPSPELMAQARAQLEAAGQPILSVVDPALGFAGLMGILGTNGPVQTWATPEFATLGLRDGILVATRGFGADLVSAEAPDFARISSGSGNYPRRYYLLDGEDQTMELRFECSLSGPVADRIEVLGKTYSARKIAETCVGDNLSFTNDYWIDSQGLLRQSSQARVPGVENMLLQRIID